MVLRADRSTYFSDPELQFLLKILMFFRVATVTLFLGVTVVVQIKGSQAIFFAPLFVIYLLIVTVYLVTIFFASIFSQVEDLQRFSVVQVGTDLTISTLMIFLSGGYESPFPFLYLFPVLWASIALRGGGYWTASFSSILYGAVVDLQYYGLIIPPGAAGLSRTSGANPWDLVGRIVLHMTAYFAVAFLGHQMAMRYRVARVELSEATSDLEKLQSLSDVVFDSITSGIVVLDDRISIRSLNRGGMSILGSDTNISHRMSIEDLFGDIPVRDLCSKASGGGINRWEGPYIGGDGMNRVMGLSISPLLEPEKGYVIIFQDLTGLRDMEEKLRTAEKLTAMGRMAASIAHEIRNPLASMSGSIQLLKDTLEPQEEDRQLMEIVLRETQRLNDLVGDFLTYARPPSPRFEDADLGQVVLDTVSFMKTSYQDSQMVIDTHVPEGDIVLSMDTAHIRQIIINLVKNAAEAVDGTGHVAVVVSRVDQDGAQVTSLSVTDDGPGISEEILPEIFEPFVTTKTKGTGLGLAIVYQLVQIHKGTVDVTSRTGDGTTITVKLPAWRETDAQE